ncbi:NAD-dependent epimerase/dehydratase family protein [Candidatus Uabimicrobium amorphum]|uniref:Dihydroflavonol-4-reductase n=1 Tax=Uabimicrobium amorphum TaxID=2596890 RepID=A0A5S9IHC6_UABAM|nr:NAD-dependent epimerase/dehydratase family protein [Candidatus Uabimicrobium amorphum]BBM81793.1 dihydroflavonol-4-reductase [Candidatus Uabimicrobium amorphum]
MNIDKTKPVMVTGATGYVAGWVVKRLLEEGLVVHAAIRQPENKEKTKYLDEIAANSPGSIKYFKADLLTPGAYAEAMQGCQVVFHTASPFFLDVKDAQKELIEPAKMGTRNVLEDVNKTESVKRVVLTSSCAAIYGDNRDLYNAPQQTLTEEVWNTSSSVEHQPYSYSKMLAEKEAWDICKEQDRWDLVTVNPSLVLGPGINPFGTSESFALIKQMGDGTFKMGTPNWAIGVIDVRDLAEAHLRCAFIPEAKGRYIISAQSSSFPHIASILREKFGKAYPFPKKSLPKAMVWLFGPIVNPGLSRKAISYNVNHPWKADNSKSKKELGMEYRPLQESLADFFQQMIDNGYFNKK